MCGIFTARHFWGVIFCARYICIFNKHNVFQHVFISPKLSNSKSRLNANSRKRRIHINISHNPLNRYSSTVVTVPRTTINIKMKLALALLFGIVFQVSFYFPNISNVFSMTFKFFEILLIFLSFFFFNF